MKRTAHKHTSTNLNGPLKQHCNDYMTKTAQQESTKVKLLNDGVYFHTLLLHFALVLQVNWAGTREPKRIKSVVCQCLCSLSLSVCFASIFDATAVC